jgi:phospholipid/cholesterol/gamma-HCH transport system permease protein
MSAPPRLHVESGRVCCPDTGRWPAHAAGFDGLAAQLATSGLLTWSGISRRSAAWTARLPFCFGEPGATSWPARLKFLPLHRQVLERVAELPHEIAMPPALRVHPIEFIG